MKSKLYKLLFCAALVLGFIFTKLDGTFTKLADDAAGYGQRTAEKMRHVASAHRDEVAGYAIDAWDVADVVKELHDESKEVNEWSVFYKAYFKSLSTTIATQDLEKWCSIDYRNTGVQSELEWRARLKSLHKISFADIAARGVKAPRDADDSNAVDRSVMVYIEQRCSSYEANRLFFSGGSQSELDSLQAKYPRAEVVHARFTERMTLREQQILKLAKELAGDDEGLSAYLEKARQLWIQRARTLQRLPN